MDLLEAFDHIANHDHDDGDRDDKAACPVVLEYRGCAVDNVVTWTVFRTALASLSGELEEAVTLSQLDGALVCGETLYEAGIVTQEQVQEEVKHIFSEYLNWCERVGLDRVAPG